MQRSGVNPKRASHQGQKKVTRQGFQVRCEESEVTGQLGVGEGHRGTGETGYLQVVSVGVASCPSECWGAEHGGGAEEKKKNRKTGKGKRAG